MHRSSNWKDTFRRFEGPEHPNKNYQQKKKNRLWRHCYRYTKNVTHKQRILVLSFNAYSLFFSVVITIVYTDKNLSSGDLASLFIRIWWYAVFHIKKYRHNDGCGLGVFGGHIGGRRNRDLAIWGAWHSAGGKVPAEEIKIDCRGIFEKMRSRKANEIKGFQIGIIWCRTW